MVTGEIERGQEFFITGLRNGHGVENQTLAMMKHQIDRIEHYPKRRNGCASMSPRQMGRLPGSTIS